MAATAACVPVKIMRLTRVASTTTARTQKDPIVVSFLLVNSISTKPVSIPLVCYIQVVAKYLISSASSLPINVSQAFP